MTLPEASAPATTTTTTTETRRHRRPLGALRDTATHTADHVRDHIDPRTPNALRSVARFVVGGVGAAAIGLTGAGATLAALATTGLTANPLLSATAVGVGTAATAWAARVNHAISDQKWAVIAAISVGLCVGIALAWWAVGAHTFSTAASIAVAGGVTLAAAAAAAAWHQAYRATHPGSLTVEPELDDF